MSRDKRFAYHAKSAAKLIQARTKMNRTPLPRRADCSRRDYDSSVLRRPRTLSLWAEQYWVCCAELVSCRLTAIALIDHGQLGRPDFECNGDVSTAIRRRVTSSDHAGYGSGFSPTQCSKKRTTRRRLSAAKPLTFTRYCCTFMPGPRIDLRR